MSNIDILSKKTIIPVKVRVVNRQTAYSNYNYVYQPNFVLINDNALGSVVFGDILPKLPTYQQLTSLIISTSDNLQALVLGSRVVFVCIASILNQFFGSITYQSYTVLVQAYALVQDLPSGLGHLGSKAEDAINTIIKSENRNLWWLETRLDMRNTIEKALEVILSIFRVARRLYLALAVFAFLSVLTVSSIVNASASQAIKDSPIQRLVDAHTYSTDRVGNVPMVAGVSSISDTSDTTNAQVFEYTVKESDTLAVLSEKFGIKAETIQFNNNLKSEVVTDQKLAIPVADSYIYHASANITPQDLERIYGVSAANIINLNTPIYKDNAFASGSNILIPTSDFNTIAQANLNEAGRLAKAEEAARNASLKQSTFTPTTATADTAQGEDLGLIFPTIREVRTSRCLQPGHIACDFAVLSGNPPIFAAKEGRVIAARYGYNSGYGNFIKIDHGNGVVTSYMHLIRINVKEGDIVSQGDTIGYMGSTGNSTGTHLHFEVIINGILRSPMRYLPYTPPCEGVCKY